MAARSKARKRALDVLFEAEVRGDPVLALLAERITFGGTDQGGPPVPEYAAELVRGVITHQERIDELIAEHAEGWSMERMPAVDRNVLRIGVYELFWADNVPDGVVISEAVQLAGDLSTDASSGFVNGLLARLADLKPTITLYPAPASAPEPPAPEPPAPEPAEPGTG
jgi:N utilization substance protein B